MITVAEFARLKERVAALEARKERAAGAVEELRKALKKEFNVTTIEEAEALAAELEADRDKLQRRFDKAMAELETDHADLLKGVRDGG